MDLFEKISEAAKNVGNKADELIEITGLNAKICAEESAIEDIKAEIGELCWTKYASGAPLEGDIGALCEKLKAAHDRIAAFEAEIAGIKRQAEERKAAEEAAAALPPKCPGCGMELPKGAKFCLECGTPIKPPAPPVTEPEPAPAAPPRAHCERCGALLEAGARFCAECGAPAILVAPAAPAKVFCEACGALLEPGALFCQECGAKRA